MTHALDQSITELLDASLDDEETLGLALADRIFGFHAQPSAEKLLKALIGGHAQRFAHTHDLAQLMQKVVALGEDLPAGQDELTSLTSFAGVWRYQAPEQGSLSGRDRCVSASPLCAGIPWRDLQFCVPARTGAQAGDVPSALPKV